MPPPCFGAVTGQGFIAEIFALFANSKTASDDDVALAIKVILQEHDSEDLIETVFKPTTGVHYAEISQR
jgi:hypothetical protein